LSSSSRESGPAGLQEALEALSAAGLDPVRLRDLPYGVQLRLHSAGRSCRVNLYHSEKKGVSLVAVGGSPHLVEEAMEAVSDPPPEGTWIGSDEAGKGDFLGGLSVCALCCERGRERILRRLGARDSKGMSREAVRRVALDVRKSGLFPFRVEVLQPPEYNAGMERWRERGGNSHDLLASLHGRTIGALLESGCPAGEIIVDRFCSPSRLRAHLPADAPHLTMAVRGERDPAVAAAAVIARQAYMDGLAALSEELGVDMPPGSGKAADRAASELVDIHGPGVLRRACKLHFRNARRLREQRT
jgi:ribonuclease HIII